MDHLTRKAWLGLFVVQAVFATMLFGAAGTLAYARGWTVWTLILLCNLAITAYFLRNDRGLIERRIKAGPAAETDPSQRVIQRFASVGICTLIIVSGLDRRFGWSFQPASVAILGLAMILAGYAIIFLTFRENSFASGVIEISRGQQVVDTGLYAIVRHPMYSGALLGLVGLPLALGSWWGLTASAFLVGVLVARLLNEEAYLAANLPGYREYMARVLHRLVPFV
jgi:protein-S-isoprenylcysteine O-methyltransferase Ste14